MKRTREPAVRRLAVPLALALAVAACGKSSTSPDERPSPTGKSLAGTLYASGATFPLRFYEEAINEFVRDHSRVTINYAGGGSEKGRTELQNKAVDFAGSDGLIRAEDLPKYQGGQVLNVPTVAAPITISYNLPDARTLKLTPELIAKIFQRQIKKWNDAAIKAANPDTNLPATDITVVHRSDGSGTTENFTKYLVAAAGTVWTLGSGATVTWPSDTQGGNGNAGVAGIVKSTGGAVGYVDLSDAEASGLRFAEIQNKAGRSVAPALAGASAALAGAKVNDDLSYDPLNADGADAYPITAPTWILVYANQTDQTKADIIKAFLNYVVTDGQDLARDLNYARLPRDLADRAVAQIDRITVGTAHASASSPGGPSVVEDQERAGHTGIVRVWAERSANVHPLFVPRPHGVRIPPLRSASGTCFIRAGPGCRSVGNPDHSATAERSRA